MSEKRKNAPYVKVVLGSKEMFMIEQLKDKLLIVHNAQVLRTALQHLFRSTFKEYLQKQNFVPSIPQDEQRKMQKEKVGKALCETLGGEIDTDDMGNKICVYTTYNKGGAIVHTAKNIVPLGELSDIHVLNQYKGGTKEQILEALIIQEENEKQAMEDVEIFEEEIQGKIDTGTDGDLGIEERNS